MSIESRDSKAKLLPDEALARGLVKAWFDEYTGTIDPLIMELAASAVHDGMEIKESMTENKLEEEKPDHCGLEHYTLGYIHGVSDRDLGTPKEGV